jgi:hypothetical protein
MADQVGHDDGRHSPGDEMADQVGHDEDRHSRLDTVVIPGLTGNLSRINPR